MKKKISLIGIGKLGLCFALTLENAGYEVLGCDISDTYVRSLNQKSFSSSEPGVSTALQRSKNFRATTNIEETVRFSNVIFLLVATPSLQSGRYDHDQIESVLKKLTALGPQENHKQLVVCCTTMPSYCDSVQEILKDYNYTVSYNPEFIAQGRILKDQLNPDMVLIGQGSNEAGKIIQEIYENHTKNNPKICRMSVTEAEICKISLNCFLTTKIAFANMVGDVARFSSCDPHIILEAIGSDSRVGTKYLGYGYGFGGPCFPRDNRALAIYSRDVGIEATISIASDKSNKLHLQNQINHFLKNNDDQIVKFDYVTYKPESTMIVESQQLAFAVGLAKAGRKVLIKERKSVIKNLKDIYGELFIYEERK